MRQPFPSSRLEVLTPDDDAWPAFSISILYEGGTQAWIQPPPPDGSRVVHVDCRVVAGAIVETIDVICEV